MPKPIEEAVIPPFPILMVTMVLPAEAWALGRGSEREPRAWGRGGARSWKLPPVSDRRRRDKSGSGLLPSERVFCICVLYFAYCQA